MPVEAPILVSPGTGEINKFGSNSEAELKVEGSQTGGEFGVVELRVAAGDEPPLHVHRREEETVYLLSGEITAYVGDAEIDVAPGSYAVLPRDIPHTFKVKGDEARLLVTEEPAGPERFFVPENGSEADPADFGIEFV